MAEAGRPTELTDELYLKIRQAIFEGKNYKTIKEELEIPAGTWDTWINKDYNLFRTKLDGWNRDVMLKQAESNLKEIIHLPVSTEDTKLTKIIADTSMFVSETLGKKIYSKRSEQTGADGKDLPTPIININREVSSDNSVSKDK